MYQEVKTYQTEDLFAASFARDSPEYGVTLVDSPLAYFNAYISRHVFMELPAVAGHSRDSVGELVKCMYGVRGAAQGWEGAYRQALEKLDALRGRGGPCVFRHRSRDLRLTVHGDDLFAAGRRLDVEVFGEGFLREFEGQAKERIEKVGDEIRLLNRVARWAPEEYAWEADQRHAEIISLREGWGGNSRGPACPG